MQRSGFRGSKRGRKQRCAHHRDRRGNRNQSYVSELHHSHGMARPLIISKLHCQKWFQDARECAARLNKRTMPAHIFSDLAATDSCPWVCASRSKGDVEARLNRCEHQLLVLFLPIPANTEILTDSFLPRITGIVDRRLRAISAA